MKGFEAHITMKEGVRPVFVKPRKVPYALKEAVETELEKLERHGVIEKTERAMWSSQNNNNLFISVTYYAYITYN